MTDAKDKTISAIRVADSDAGRVVGQSLRSLRERCGLTQEEMAERLGVGQASISKIERRGDVQISSLHKYVTALGATLRIEVAFGAQSTSSFENDVPDDDQLVLPIFRDNVFRQQRDVVLSIKPEYSNKILDGSKTVELRRRFPASPPLGTIAYIYSTSPVQALVGQAEIGGVVRAPVSKLWKQFGRDAQIARADFDNYFAGVSEGFALKLRSVAEFTRPLRLTELRDRFGFEPPQSFVYAKPILRTALRYEQSVISN